MDIVITKEAAKRFLLYKHGLLGSFVYQEADIVSIVQSLGCIQYDPIDVCGTNAELVLQARIKNLSKELLYKELYINRTLFEYFDKNMSIIDINDYSYFNNIRNRFREDYYQNNNEFMIDEVNGYLDKFDYISTKDIKSDKKIDWLWSKASIVKATLEAMYYSGELLIHHRKKSIRYFSKPVSIIPYKLINGPVIDNDIEYYKFRVKRRIKGVGLLWNKPSDAFLFISNLNSKIRNQIFSSLKEEGLITEINIEGLKDIFYIDSSDLGLLNKINDEMENRIEFIAPLDNLLWDRKLIKCLFDFDYKWEIYTKEENRTYGYYTLPILYNTNLIGRIEIIAKRNEKILNVKNIWFEDGFIVDKGFKDLLEERLNRFMIFNSCTNLNISKNTLEKLQ